MKKVIEKPPDAVLMVSFAPYIKDDGYTFMKDIKPDAKDQIVELVQKITDFDGTSDICLWTHDFMPVLCYDQADKLVEYINWWSEKDPTWFNLQIRLVPKKADFPDRYCVVLMPNLDKSKERFIYRAMLQKGIIIPTSTKYHILFQTLRFISKNIGTYPNIKLAEKMKLGIIDKKNISRPENCKESNIQILVPFPVNAVEFDYSQF